MLFSCSDKNCIALLYGDNSIMLFSCSDNNCITHCCVETTASCYFHVVTTIVFSIFFFITNIEAKLRQ